MPNIINIYTHWKTICSNQQLKNFSDNLFAVIVQGIDKFENDEGELERSWTNYIEVSAPVWHGNNGESVNAFIGGAFSPVQDANFYYDKAAINNVGLTFKKEVKILESTLPVSATAMWNPALNQVALQFSVDLL